MSITLCKDGSKSARFLIPSCLLAVLFGMLLSSCGTTPIKSDLISVYKEGEKPEKPYEKVKLLTYVDWAGKEKKALNYFIRKAEKENADAIILLPHENAGIFGLPSKYRFKALAIRWAGQPASK